MSIENSSSSERLNADPTLACALTEALAAPFKRVRRLALPDGRIVWLKRVERLSGRMRLQKGDPARAFEAEREALHRLAQLRVPVPEILAEGADWFALADAGEQLVRLVSHGAADQHLPAFQAAGQALARLHGARLVHGRPAVRDICWDGRQARFIDLERFATGRSGQFWQALDVLLFVHSAYVQWPEDDHLLEAALASYLEAAPEGMRGALHRLGRRLSLLVPVIGLLQRLRPQSRELRASRQAITRLRAL